jgi:protein transport protein SEC61 subunit gamma-like protein
MIMERIKSFLVQCSRVWSVLRKPSMNELKMVTKVSAIGLLIIGFLGFLISIVMNMF